MGQSSRPPANGFVAAMRKLYNPLGFSKGYNFVLFFIAIGYILGFTLARLEYFSFHGVFCNPSGHGLSAAAPGECFYYSMQPYNVGIQMHLYCILPAAFLVCFQFVPVIRHKVRLFHRINGYIVIALSLVASAGALIIVQHSFGGDMSTRTYAGVLVISTTVAYLFAYINIKSLQIDQHRAWMMRAWAYFSTIITLRLIMFISATITTTIGGFYTSMPCNKINYILGQANTLKFYPGCKAFLAGTQPAQEVAVEGNFNSATNAAEIAASLDLNFGAAGWLALWLHVIIIEFYLRMTPMESQRLRRVSYERQVKRGFKNPGSSGLVAQRFGDANPYRPVDEMVQPTQDEEK